MKVIRAMNQGLAMFRRAFYSLSSSSAWADEPADTTILSSATIVMVLRGNAENRPEVLEIAKGADRPETKEWVERVKDFKALFPTGKRHVWVINTNADQQDRMARAGRLFRIYPEDVILITRWKYEWRKFLVPTTIWVVLMNLNLHDCLNGRVIPRNGIHSKESDHCRGLEEARTAC